MLETQDFIDAPSHALFLGTAKTLFKDVFSIYLSTNKTTKSFVSQLNVKLKELNAAGISYVEVKESVGDTELKFTQFLSKHYVCLVRCSKWLFNHFQSTVREHEESVTVPNHEEYYDYNKKEIIQFCSERLIDCPLTTKLTELKYRNWFCQVIHDPITSFADYEDTDIIWYIF